MRNSKNLTYLLISEHSERYNIMREYLSLLWNIPINQIFGAKTRLEADALLAKHEIDVVLIYDNISSRDLGDVGMLNLSDNPRLNGLRYAACLSELIIRNKKGHIRICFMWLTAWSASYVEKLEYAVGENGLATQALPEDLKGTMQKFVDWVQED